MSPLDSLWARVLPPALIALAQWIIGIHLVPEYDGMRDWKIVGLALPVFWLASVGPRGLAARGGWCMRLWRWRRRPVPAGGPINLGEAREAYRRNRVSASVVALVWLAAGLAAGWGVQYWSPSAEELAALRAMGETAPTAPYKVKLLFALLHTGITASLGVFVFLAMLPEEGRSKA